MLFSKTCAILTALIAAVAPALAFDYRQLYNFSGGDGVAFCKSWKCECINYSPKSNDLYFKGAVCEVGNSSGKNTNSQARAFCNFTDGKTVTSVNKHIAASTGATPA